MNSLTVLLKIKLRDKYWVTNPKISTEWPKHNYVVLYFLNRRTSKPSSLSSFSSMGSSVCLWVGQDTPLSIFANWIWTTLLIEVGIYWWSLNNQHQQFSANIFHFCIKIKERRKEEKVLPLHSKTIYRNNNF